MDNIPFVQRLEQSSDDPHPFIALDFILAAIGCPPNHFRFISLIVHQCANRTSPLEISDVTLANMITTKKHSIEASKTWLKYHRRAFREWQTNADILLIAIVPGHRTLKTNVKTSYSVPVWPLMLEAVQTASQSRTWTTSKNKAIQESTRHLIKQHFPSKIVKIDRWIRRERPQTRGEKMLATLIHLRQSGVLGKLSLESLTYLIDTNEN